MALTAKPQSTISYNTEAFLKRQLDRLLEAQVIVDYRYIKHDGENGDKDHMHVWIEPNKRIDTGALVHEFKEIDPNNEKPLGVMPFRSSKRDHWIMYAIHDQAYLEAHHSTDEDGKKAYTIDDVKTPYPEALIRDYKSAKQQIGQTENQRILELIRDHMTITEVCSVLDVNPSKVAVLYRAYQQDIAELHNKDRDRISQGMIDKALDLFGKVQVVEEGHPTRLEKRNNLTRELITTIEYDQQTGEIKQTKEWETKDDE